MEPMYVIGESELLQLLNDQRHLKALYAAGVDNWEGIDECDPEYLSKVPSGFMTINLFIDQRGV